jgi:glycosyltransferase involved in cell wall biosynthesis
MKILLISPFFPPEIGSAAHLYFELAQAFQNRGHEIIVLTGIPRYHVVGNQREYQKRFRQEEYFHGLKVIRGFNLDIPWDIPICRGLDQNISALCSGLIGLGLPPFDVALVYSPPLPLALAALAFCRLRRRPLAVNIQDLFPQSAIDLGILKNPYLIRMFRKLESFLIREADLIWVHSEGNRGYVAEIRGNPAKVKVVPNWVDTQILKPAGKHNGVRVSLGLKGHFIVSFAGVMGYSQDLETVLSCAQLLRDNPNIAFLLVGDGVEKSKLLHLAQHQNLPNVHFLPMQPREKYSEVLAASDVCLTTLRKEVKTPVVPSKISSIMAAGRPVLASLPLEGDASRLIQEARCGLCLPPEDPEALAQAVDKLYLAPALRGKMGANGRRYAVKHLSLESCVERLESQLMACSRERTRPVQSNA